MNSLATYLKEVRAELKRVIWPSRGDTIRFTLYVVVFSLIVAAILGAADIGLLKGVESLLRKA